MSRRRLRLPTAAEQAAMDRAAEAVNELLAEPSRKALARFRERLNVVYAAHPKRVRPPPET